jgi:hypothetical protein
MLFGSTSIIDSLEDLTIGNYANRQPISGKGVKELNRVSSALNVINHTGGV